MRLPFIVLVVVAGACTELGQQVRARHAQVFQCRPGWVDVKSLGIGAGTSRYVARGCGHTVTYACAEGRPCEALRQEPVEPLLAPPPAR